HPLVATRRPPRRSGVAAPPPLAPAPPPPPRAPRPARPAPPGARRRTEPPHVERMAGGEAQPPPLADGEMDDAGMSAQHAAVEIDDVARLGRARLEPLDHLRIAARRHEADVLAVVLVGDREVEPARKLPRLGLGLVAER